MKHLSLRHYLLLLAFFLVFLILRMPASVFGLIAASASGGQLKLAATAGTLWHGSGQPLLNGAAIGEQLHWDWRARELLHGRLGYKIALDDGTADLAIGLHDIALSQADLNLAADPIFALDERSRSYGLTGQLHLSTSDFRWHGTKAEGTLAIDWLNAGSTLAPSVDPLGNYRLTATAVNDGWKLQVNTQGGRLQLNGTGLWKTEEGLNTDLSLRAEAGSETALAPFLTRLGPGAPTAERRLHLKLS
jgi:general secretion pathway protein N